MWVPRTGTPGLTAPPNWPGFARFAGQSADESAPRARRRAPFRVGQDHHDAGPAESRPADVHGALAGHRGLPDDVQAETRRAAPAGTAPERALRPVDPGPG